MELIIVESPTKAKTINKFLGKKFKVQSSFGHVRDLPKSKMGIDIENDFLPQYTIPDKAKQTIKNLKKESEKADSVILASDEDREGEAIAWHLTKALDIKQEKIKRIVFHEITEEAINKALAEPRQIDMRLVDAQQARRILDRLVGYELSPFLWKKVARGLSAGRVQSVAVRLIIEREREIQAFTPQEYWSIEGEFKNERYPDFPITAKLNKIEGKSIGKMDIKTDDQATEILKELKNASYSVKEIEKKQSKKSPLPPFTTSTLQQTANRWFGFSAKQTMVTAQQLYEGISVSKEGQVGLITYMRTDSFNLASKFLEDSKNYLEKNLGSDYCLKSPRTFKKKSKGAQEAHEAIRPTDVKRDPESIKDSLNSNQYRLYKLIWQRAVASQMPEAVMDTTSIDVEAEKTPYQFRATGQIIKFPGFLKIYPEKSKELELPDLKKSENLDLVNLNKNQHFTKPPGRYSDAGLVKELEKHGIGRPSTYAPTISTIIARNYVNRDDNKKLYPTDIAFVVNDLLVSHFPQIVDYKFTAEMEEDLDKIAYGEKKWQPVIKNFYNPFHKNLEEKYETITKKEIMPEEKSKEICEKCKSRMVIKTGRFGKFLACSGYPECKNIKSMGDDKEKQGNNEEIEKLQKKYQGEVCDKCGSDMAIKNGKFGPFLACTAYPKCKNIKSIEENKNTTGIKCPKCGKGEIVQKRSKRGIFYACDNYPDCKNAYWGKPTGEKCPECENLLIEGKNNTIQCSNKECDYKKN